MFLSVASAALNLVLMALVAFCCIVESGESSIESANLLDLVKFLTWRGSST